MPLSPSGNQGKERHSLGKNVPINYIVSCAFIVVISKSETEALSFIT